MSGTSSVDNSMAHNQKSTSVANQVAGDLPLCLPHQQSLLAAFPVVGIELSTTRDASNIVVNVVFLGKAELLAMALLHSPGCPKVSRPKTPIMIVVLQMRFLRQA